MCKVLRLTTERLYIKANFLGLRAKAFINNAIVIKCNEKLRKTLPIEKWMKIVIRFNSRYALLYVNYNK